jgi:hypothetical protein
MTWELYEVWAEDNDGHEELIDTTKSHKEAKALAKKALNEGAVRTRICRETGTGDYDELEQFENG